MISNQLLFDETQTCAVIRTSSSPASPPIRMRIQSGSAATRPKIGEKQTEQYARTPRGVRCSLSESAPATSRNALAGMRAFAVKAVPVVRRQWLQWQ